MPPEDGADTIATWVAPSGGSPPASGEEVEMHRRVTQMLIGLVLFGGGVPALASPQESDTSSKLLGTWRLVSATYGVPGDQFHYVPQGLVHLKHITPTHFTVITYEAQSK